MKDEEFRFITKDWLSDNMCLVAEKIKRDLLDYEFDEFDEEDYNKFTNESISIPIEIDGDKIFGYKKSCCKLGHKYGFSKQIVALNKDLNITNNYYTFLMYRHKVDGIEIKEDDIIKSHIMSINDLHRSH